MATIFPENHYFPANYKFHAKLVSWREKMLCYLRGVMLKYIWKKQQHFLKDVFQSFSS